MATGRSSERATRDRSEASAAFRRLDRVTRPIARLAGVLSLIAVLGLAGCVPEPATPAPSETSTAASTAPASPEPPAAPALVADGDADANLPYFSQVVGGVWGSEDRAAGRAYVDALVSAGFDKAAMQVTEDSSTVGNPAESIQFSVRWGDDCLMGQVGPATGDPVTTVMAGLPSGGCLLGQTRPIDW